MEHFLTGHKAEVKYMCITEYDKVKAFAQQKAEGIAEGKAAGILETPVGLVKDGLLSVSAAAGRINMPEAEFEKLLHV